MLLWPDAVTDTVNQSCIDAWVYLLLGVQKSFQFCCNNGESLFHILNLEVTFYVLLCILSWCIKGVCIVTCMWGDFFCVCVYKKKRTTKFIDNWIEHSTVEWGHPDQKYICQMLSLISESQLWIFRYVCSFGISVEVMKLIRAHWVGRDKHIGI